MAAFTTIAAGVGVAAQAGGGLMSFGQAKRARQAAQNAKRKSEKLMKEARERAETNFYEGLNVRLDAFGEQYRQNLANQTQQVEALQDADPRTLAAGIGKVASAGTAANEQTRIGMQQQLMELDEKKADADEAIKQQTIAMDVGAAADQEKIRKEKEIEAAKAKTAGINQSIKAGVGGLSMVAPMFEGKKLEGAELDQLLKFLGGGFQSFGESANTNTTVPSGGSQ